DGPVDHMHAMPILTDYVKSNYDTSNIVVVSPDAGRVKVAEKWAQELGNAPLAFVHKTRDIDVANKITSNRVVGDVSGRTCVLLDDMIDTGGTIAGAVKVLREAGANDVIIATTHGVFSDPARERLSECGAREVITTDTLPQNTDHWDNLTVLSIAPLLAKTIHEIFENGSVTNLFE
ncbi:ribose-phosphate diphosphokinase, partial [Klebsiella pneumoniae]